MFTFIPRTVDNPLEKRLNLADGFLQIHLFGDRLPGRIQDGVRLI